MIRFDEKDIELLSIPLPDSVDRYKKSAQFEKEISEIDKILGDSSLSRSLERRLSLERVIASVMKDDYSRDFESMLSLLRERYEGVKEETLKELTALGYADYILKDGEVYYQDDALANIRVTCSRFLKNLKENGSHDIEGCPAECYRGQNNNARIMKERGGRAFRFTLTFSMSLSDDFVREGEEITVHLPYPTECAEQSDVELISSSHPVYISDSDQRTACIKAIASKGERYSVTFSYVSKYAYNQFDPSKVSSEQPSFYTEEKPPHITFTPHVRELAKKIVGSEKNPLLMAKAIYDYLTNEINYSYMRPYLCLDNISEFALQNKRGDCGVQSIAFITLCRALSIPARWQSGATVSLEDGIGSHDWAEIYVAPYGWIPVDTSYGGGARRRKDEFIREYFFGNLDPFRLITSKDFQAEFDPPKSFLRTDPYDNQVGEAEYKDSGAFFSDFRTSRTVESEEDLTDIYFK